MSVLWSKTRRDLFQNRARFITIVLSIFLGVFALGVVLNLGILLSETMDEGRVKSQPAHIQISASGIREMDIQRIGRMPGVGDVETLTIVSLKWKQSATEEWDFGLFVARENYVNLRMELLTLLSGDWPTKRTAAMERMTNQYYDLSLGASIQVKTGEDTYKEIPLTGVVHSYQATSPRLGGSAVFFVTPETMQWLTGLRQPNVLYARMIAFDEKQAQLLGEFMTERAGTLIPAEVTAPNSSSRQGQIQAVTIILGVLGGGILALAALLILNVFNAIMLQQVRQIGSMKTIGADTGRVLGFYLVIALAYGFLAMLPALPLSSLAAHSVSGLLLSFLNLDAPALQIFPQVWLAQAVLSLGMPVVAAIFPVFDGSRITIRQAIQNYGVGVPFGHGWLEKGLLGLQSWSVALAVSIRNTLRRKQRSLLTLFMLVLGGLLFISVMGVRGSFHVTMMQMVSVFRYDVYVSFTNPERAEEILRLAAKAPGLESAEMHWVGDAVFIFDDAKERTLVLRALPPETNAYLPNIIAGRWLQPGENDAIVLNAKIAEEEGVQIGDRVTMKLAHKRIQWRVVGLAFDMTNRQRTVFVPLSAYAKLQHQPGFATSLLVQTGDHQNESQERMEQELVQIFERKNILVDSVEQSNASIAEQLAPFDMIVYLLMGMAILMALVGGLGLMGAMFLNVAERMREIGVMRAIGGDSWKIVWIFINEGLALGLLSWLLAALLSPPASRVFARAIGLALFGIPLAENFSWLGMALWLAIVTLVSILASALPARQAARVSVRESLMYE